MNKFARELVNEFGITVDCITQNEDDNFSCTYLIPISQTKLKEVNISVSPGFLPGCGTFFVSADWNIHNQKEFAMAQLAFKKLKNDYGDRIGQLWDNFLVIQQGSNTIKEGEVGEKVTSLLTHLSLMAEYVDNALNSSL